MFSDLSNCIGCDASEATLGTMSSFLHQVLRFLRASGQSYMGLGKAAYCPEARGSDGFGRLW